MKETDRIFIDDDPDKSGGCIPDDIKVHSEETIKIVPDESKVFPTKSSKCKIVPDFSESEKNSDIGFNGTIHNKGEKIRIAPSAKKSDGKIFT